MTLTQIEGHEVSALLADTDSWTQVVADVAKLAAHIAGTEFVPRSLRDNPPAVCAAMLYGREVGLPPMTSLTQVYVADGRPGMHAEGMRALVLAAGHDIETLEHTGAVCTMRGRRYGREWAKPITWNLDMARAAGLLPANAKSGWAKYPRAMLLARATAELCRRDFPDVIHGLVAIEEVDDGVTTPEPAPTTTRVTRKRAAAAPVADAPPVKELPPPAPTPQEKAPPPWPEPDPWPPETETPAAPPEAQQETEDTQAPPEPPEPPAASQDAEKRKVRQQTVAQRGKILADLTGLGIRSHDDRVDTLSALIGRRVESTKELTHAESSTVLDTLALCGSPEGLANAVQAAMDYYASGDDPTYPDQPPLPLNGETEQPPDEYGHADG